MFIDVFNSKVFKELMLLNILSDDMNMYLVNEETHPLKNKMISLINIIA